MARDKKAGGEDAIERIILYQGIHLCVSIVGINASSSWDKCASKSYAEMICGINLNTAESEDPEIKKRCMSGLIGHGKKALRISGSSIQ